MRTGIPQFLLPKCKAMLEEGASLEEVAAHAKVSVDIAAAVFPDAAPKRRGRPPKADDE